MHKYYSTTVTDPVAGKQCMVQALDRKFLGKQASFDRSITTGRDSARRCLQSEIRKMNEIHKQVISKSSNVKSKAWRTIAATHFQLWKHHFSESFNCVESNYILKCRKSFGRNTTSSYHHSHVDLLFPAYIEG